MKKKHTQETVTNKPTLVSFLLDRTGSMEVCRVETIKGFNGYLDALAKNEAAKGMRFTLTQFDSQSIDLLHDAVPLKEVAKLTDQTYIPRGATPLYDAIGKTIEATRVKAGEKYKVLFVSLTDGQENASCEFGGDTVNALIKRMETDHHWTFAHIGVGLAGWNAGKLIYAGAIGANNVLRSDHDAKSQQRQYSRLAGQTVSYAANAGACGQSVSGFWKDQEPDES